ncbi:DUF4176 domain-containing protein [Liquorilactobacillus mali]|uniref:DUF4176 domain-containing protein n=1 Tax=Liquorilactobacillus mali TaxID=1618 RepID=A0A0R2FR50_9LACO|nr:DUF4176 domain-containing protein [Liquorilactobacillus mali]KRN27863.1 hypothetical protein IV36_GL000661 [Liquorilactobacillus mali]
MNEELLPLGSVVYLEEGTAKLMVVGRGAVFESDGETVYTDYVGVGYPKGINPKDTIYFNHENIDQVVFKGFVDEKEEHYMKVYKKWKAGLEIKKLRA